MHPLVRPNTQLPKPAPQRESFFVPGFHVLEDLPDALVHAVETWRRGAEGFVFFCDVFVDGDVDFEEVRYGVFLALGFGPVSLVPDCEQAELFAPVAKASTTRRQQQKIKIY